MKKVKCYTYITVQDMIGSKPWDSQKMLDLVREYGLTVFRPPSSVGSGRARRNVLSYVTTNPEFDQYIKQQQVIATLLDRKIAKATYRKMDETNPAQIFQFPIPGENNEQRNNVPENV
jgi:hypothetical protein